MRRWLWVFPAMSLACPSAAEDADGLSVYLEDNDGTRIEVAALSLSPDGARYSLDWNDAVLTDHFLSMRPFRCIEGAEKTWCRVPYPYPIRRDLSEDLVDLEYDLLFVWKNRTDYGIDMWNGVYYVIDQTPGGFNGQLHEMNMDVLAIPPEEGELRPISRSDLEPGEPESHWLPRLVIE